MTEGQKQKDWLDEIERALNRLHYLASSSMARLRIVELLLCKKLKVDENAVIEKYDLEQSLAVIRILVAQTIKDIDRDKSDVIDKLLIDFQNAKDTEGNLKPYK